MGAGGLDGLPVGAEKAAEGTVVRRVARRKERRFLLGVVPRSTPKSDGEVSAVQPAAGVRHLRAPRRLLGFCRLLFFTVVVMQMFLERASGTIFYSFSSFAPSV